MKRTKPKTKARTVRMWAFSWATISLPRKVHACSYTTRRDAEASWRGCRPDHYLRSAIVPITLPVPATKGRAK